MKITKKQLKGTVAEELAALDEDLGKAVIDAIMDKFRSKPEPEPEEEPEPEPEEKSTRRPYDHNHPDHPDHPANIRDRRRRRQSAADSKAHWSRTTDDIYGKRYKNPKGQFRQYTAGGYTREHIERITKEELEAILSEVHDMSRKGNAGKDFAIPSAAWDRAFRKNGIKISYHGRMGVEKDEWSKYRAQEVSGITYWPLYPVKGGYMGAYGRQYNVMSDSGGGHGLSLVNDAIEEAKNMCARGEYVKTGRYETSGVTPGGCKKMGWSTPTEKPTVAEELKKLTSEQIKEIIIEEMESDPALKAAIDKLSSKIEDLDVSIDYLTSAITGEDTLAIALGQKATGRYRQAPKAQVGTPDIKESNSESE